MAKLFIGCVTYAKDEHALPVLLDSLRRFTFQDWTLHFIDTTEATAPTLAPYKPRLLQKIKNQLPGKTTTTTIEAYQSRREGEVPFEVIANARNRLREQFLQTDCTHLFFIDDDMRFPPDAIDLLLSHDAPVAVGVYINVLKLKTGVVKRGPIGYITDPQDPTLCRPLMMVDVIPPRLIKILLTGFGCALIRREVLEQVSIRYDEHHQVTEDTPFYLELDKRGVPVLMDTRVKCAHLKYPCGDPRNAYFDFNNYQVSIKQKT